MPSNLRQDVTDDPAQISPGIGWAHVALPSGGGAPKVRPNNVSRETGIGFITGIVDSKALDGRSLPVPWRSDFKVERSRGAGELRSPEAGEGVVVVGGMGGEAGVPVSDHHRWRRST